MLEGELFGGPLDGMVVNRQVVVGTWPPNRLVVPRCGQYGFDKIIYVRGDDGKLRYETTEAAV